MSGPVPAHATTAASAILAAVLAEPDRVHRYDGRRRRPIEALADAGLVTVTRQTENVRGSYGYALRVHYLVRARQVMSVSSDASA
jgi:hypothetical protein